MYLQSNTTICVLCLTVSTYIVFLIILDPINNKEKFYLHKNIYFLKKVRRKAIKTRRG